MVEWCVEEWLEDFLLSWCFCCAKLKFCVGGVSNWSSSFSHIVCGWKSTSHGVIRGEKILALCLCSEIRNCQNLSAQNPDVLFVSLTELVPFHLPTLFCSSCNSNKCSLRAHNSTNATSTKSSHLLCTGDHKHTTKLHQHTSHHHAT